MAARKGGVFWAGLIALEIFGVMLAILAVGAGFLVWRIHKGPVSLALARPGLEYALDRALPLGATAQIGDAVLSRGSASGEFVLTLHDLAIAKAGQRVADFPQVELIFSAPLGSGKGIGPSGAVFTSPVIHVEQSDGQSRIHAADLGEIHVRLANLERVDVIDARISYSDRKNGRAWVAEGAHASSRRSEAGYMGKAYATFDSASGRSSLKLSFGYEAKAETLAAELFVENAPVGDLLPYVIGAPAVTFSSLVSGTANVVVGPRGEILTAGLTAAIGAGGAGFGDQRFEIDKSEIAAHFDPESKALIIEKLAVSVGESSGELSGTIGFDFDERARFYSALSFDLSAQEILIVAGETLPAPLRIDVIEARGQYEFADRRLSMDRFTASLLDVIVDGSAIARFTPEASPELVAKLVVEGALDRDRLLRAWPRGLAEGARDFVDTRMPRGEARKIVLEVSLEQQPNFANEIFNDAISLTFDIADASVIYAPTMTPLTDVHGAARLSGKQLIFSIERARAGPVRLSQGEVEFTDLAQRGAPSYYRFRADGDAKEVLNILNQRPLQVLRATPFDAARFSGPVSGRVEIMRPNQRDVAPENYRYSGEATFKDAAISEFYGSADLSSAQGRVAFDATSMIIAGSAEIGGAPIEFEWTQKPRETRDRSVFLVSGSINNAAGDLLGLPTRQFMRGAAPFKARASGDFARLHSLQVDVDFTQSELAIDSLGWSKPAGTPVRGSLELAFDEREVRAPSLSVVGEGVSISAVGRFREGKIQHLDIRDFRLEGAAEFSLNAARTGAGALDIALSGRFLDAGPLLRNLLEAPPNQRESDSTEQTALILRSRIEELRLRSGATLRDVTLDFQRSVDMIEALSFSARTAEGAPLTMRLDQTGAETGPLQAITARSDDMGALIAGLFGVTSIRGGAGSLDVSVSPAQSGAFGFSGVLNVRNFMVADAPILARIFAAGSLNGLVDLLNGEGVALSSASVEFDFRRGVMTIADARASGPSVGITGSGSIAAGDKGRVNLAGAIAPIYGVNSLLGNTPLIGDLFVNRAGEGVVALSYAVSGPSDGPTISINPLSALTPGVFRRIFERERPIAEPDAE